jgi:hypothetical protein
MTSHTLAARNHGRRRLISTIMLVAVLACGSTVASASSLIYGGRNTSESFIFHNVRQSVSNPAESYFVNYRGNPIIGGHNLYAPALVKVRGVWFNYVGGFLTPSDYNDSIYLARTNDDKLLTGWSPLVRVVDHGVYEHANDPSVVRKDSAWYMALTAKPVNLPDQCAIIASADGVAWDALMDRSHEIAVVGGVVQSCARPSLLWNQPAGRWELFFDGYVIPEGSTVGYYQQHLAYSTERVPRTFVYQQPVGDMVDADIKYLGGQYIAAFRPSFPPNPWTIDYAASPDGRLWTYLGTLLADDPLSGGDEAGVTNPGWAIAGDKIHALLFGRAATVSYADHKIGIALPQAAIMLRSGEVGHVLRQALDANSQRVETFNYTAVDWVEAYAHPGGALLLSQPITATLGDTFYLLDDAATPASVAPNPLPTTTTSSPDMYPATP